MNEVVTLSGISNQVFLETYAKPGRIGLSGGFTLIDKAISHAERRISASGQHSLWSHAFVFQGLRHDDRHWVIESDLQVHRRHIQLGVQENRIDKYFDESLYTRLAVLDFGLDDSQVATLLREGLELVASRARYSLRELVGTFIALHHPELRSQDNLLAREKSMYCSAFVRHLFRRSGFDLAPGVEDKHTTPEDISQTPIPHLTYILKRGLDRNPIKELTVRLRRRLRARIKHRREKRAG
ncbi:MAG TPA: hypothetical protein VLU94_00100 [Candidatus Nitrosotalea sp.]|nr:hypothetical protein [Candidatus Nitrosotalea sp.]